MKARTVSQLQNIHEPVTMGLRLSNQESVEFLILSRKRKYSFSVLVSELLASIKEDFSKLPTNAREFSFSGKITLPYPKKFNCKLS